MRNDIDSGKDGEQKTPVRPCPADEKRFGDETEALSKVSDWQRTAEKLICLIYIGFIQTVVARLHTLLVSVALMFSLVTLGIAIYPFTPISPFLLAGLILLLLIAWAFFKVFSEMDTDPILARIVNGDDSKLQGSFYMKFAEAISLPLLTLASSLCSPAAPAACCRAGTSALQSRAIVTRGQQVRTVSRRSPKGPDLPPFAPSPSRLLTRRRRKYD